MKKNLIPLILAAIVALSATACAQTDVIGKISVTSFDAILQLSEPKKDEGFGGWMLEAPDGTARLYWSADFKASTRYDVMMETLAKPFVNAGLDPARLPAGMYADGKILVGRDLGDSAFDDSARETALASFEQLVKTSRSAIGYHAALDHYGVDLGGGNMFEWARELSVNDKDIVFILDPQLLIAAGVDPAKVDGWVFAGVEIMDNEGKPVTVDKFLKPFEIG